MSEQNTVDLKQRVIGALVLVSLGVIFIPLLLNGGPEKKSSSFDKTIPEMPQKLSKVLPAVPKPMEMPAPKQITAYPERSSKEIKTLNKPPKSATKTAPAQSRDKIVETASSKGSDEKLQTIKKANYKKAKIPGSSKITTAYTIQIASFSKKNNAIVLQKKLRKKNFKAYIESFLTKKGRLYRLRVGPYLKFDQITRIKKQIEAKFKLKGMIIVEHKA